MYQRGIDLAGRVQPFARVLAREHHLYDLGIPDGSGKVIKAVRVTGAYEYRATGPADFPAPGDWVSIEESSGTWRITGLLPRKTSLSRHGAGEETIEQVLAANITALLLVFGLDGGRNFLVRLLERALAVAWNSGAQPIVVLNKADCADPETIAESLDDARSAAPGAEVFAVSAETGEGIAELAAQFHPGDTLGMLGKSGVGKSALVNALDRQIGTETPAGPALTGGPVAATGPEPAASKPTSAAGSSTAASAGTGGPASTPTAASAAGSDSPASLSSVTPAHAAAPEATSSTSPLARVGRQRTGDLQGRHTTTSSALYGLGSGIMIIDGPGIRELQIWAQADDLRSVFAEIEDLGGNCRFRDCTHNDEPGCAVHHALETGELDSGRYEGYLALVREQAYLDRRQNQRAMTEERNKWKKISKAVKGITKMKRGE